jgi:hypothetical protein
VARAEFKDNREAWEVGQAIVAAWFKVLSQKDQGTTPSNNPVPGRLGNNEKIELQAVFNEIFLTKIAGLIIDPPDATGGIYILVPQPPPNIDSVEKLIGYLASFHNTTQPHHFHEELGDAVVFGCGK